MTVEKPYTLTFQGASPADGNRYAGDLAAALRDADRHVSVEQRRQRSDTQDFGATLAIVLGTASVTAVAKGLASWLARNSGAIVEIERDGRVIAKNLDSRDAAKIAEAFSQPPNQSRS